MKKYFEQAICILIVLHALLIIITPLGLKMYRRFPLVFRVYVNQLGLSTSWTLFSPNPPLDRKVIVTKKSAIINVDPSMVVKDKKDKGKSLSVQEPLEVIFYTPRTRLYGLGSRRELTFLKYFFQRGRLKTEFWPMLCHKDPSGIWKIEVKNRIKNEYITKLTKEHNCVSQ